MSEHFSLQPNLRFSSTHNNPHVHVRLQGCIDFKVPLPANAAENKVRELVNSPNAKTAFSKIWTEYICFVGSLSTAKSYVPLDSTAKEQIPIEIVPTKSICFQPPFPLRVVVSCKEPASNGQIQVALHNRVVWKIWITLVTRCREVVKWIHYSIPNRPIPLPFSDVKGSVNLKQILQKLDSTKRKRTREE